VKKDASKVEADLAARVVELESQLDAAQRKHVQAENVAKHVARNLMNP